MNLQLFSYSKSGGIVVAIQVFTMGNVWDDNVPTLHECKNQNQASTIAQAVADITGSKVRVTYPPNSHVTAEQVGRLNGAYYNRKG